MHVIISIDDQANGEPSVKSMTHPVALDVSNIPQTPAIELAEFVLTLTQIWLNTRKMDEAQRWQYVQSLVKQPAKQH